MREGDLRIWQRNGGSKLDLEATYRPVGFAGAGALVRPAGASTPKLDTYELTAPTPEGGSRHGRLQVLIAEPIGAEGSRWPEHRHHDLLRASIQYLKGAQWADRLPKVVQARLADTFQKSGRFGGVGRPGEGLAIDYQVIVDIRAFEVRVDGRQRRPTSNSSCAC